MALTPHPGGLASFSPCLGEAHLLWDDPDFCLGGRRGPSAYMPSSPGRVKIWLFTLSPQDGKENIVKVIREIQGVLSIAKRKAATLKQSPHNHRGDLQWRQRPWRELTTALQQRDWAGFLLSTQSYHCGCQRAPGRGQMSL